MKPDPDFAEYHKRWAAAYESSNYEKGLAAYFMRSGHAFVEQQFTPDQYHPAILEVGAGFGIHHAFVRHKFDRYVMTDSSGVVLATVRERLHDVGRGTLECQVENAAELSFEDASFDRLIATHVLEHMDDLRSRLANRVQLTSDGHKAYLEAVEGAFGGDVDYAMLVKLYGPSSELAKGRYSPAECIGARKKPIEGNPDPKYISTSFAERSNLSVRMHTRRFTRLTNAFSKKIENHAHSVALFALYYNFVRIHKTLRTTPAMAANVTKRLWEIGDIVDVLEAWEALS
jgi:hypothetical protein